MTARARLLGTAAPQGISMPMNLVLKFIKLAIRPVGVAPSIERFGSFLDGGGALIANAHRGAAIAGQPQPPV
jgi:hypothetical protein